MATEVPPPPILWEHAPVIVPLDVQQAAAHIGSREPHGWELVTLTTIAVGGAAHLDERGQLVPGQAQPAFLLVFKRPKRAEVGAAPPAAPKLFEG